MPGMIGTGETAGDPHSRRKNVLKLAAFVALGIAVMAVGFWFASRYLGSWQEVNALIDRISQYLNQPAGPFLFLILCASSVLLRGFGYVMIVIAARTYPFAPAFLLCWVGLVFGTTCVFLISRFLLQDYLRPKLEKGFFRGLDRVLKENGIISMFLLRSAFLLYRTINWPMGATSIATRDFFIGNALGLVPTVLVVLITARQIHEMRSVGDLLLPRNLLIAGILTLVLAGMLIIRRKYFPAGGSAAPVSEACQNPSKAPRP